MSKYCPNCLAKVDEKTLTCKNCGEDLSLTDLTEEQARALVQGLNKKKNAVRHFISHCLSFLVIGVTLLIIGFFFYYLAFKTVTVGETKEHILNKECVEFFVSMTALIAGGLCALGGGSIGLTLYFYKRRIMSDIEQIRKDRSTVVGKPTKTAA